MSKRAVICARVSTTSQAERGHSIPTQLDLMRKYATREGLTVIAELQDDISGTVPIRQRPGGRSLYEFIDNHSADAVIFFTVDRITRDEDLIEINMLRRDVRNAGMELHYANDGGKADLSTMGGMIDTFKAAVAAEERKKIVERTIRGRNAKARAGKIIGAWRAPYGYRRDGDKLVVDEKEAEIVRQMFAWYANGDDEGKPITNAAIGRRLAEMRIPTPTHGITKRPRKRADFSWNERTLRQILKRETYAGVWRYGKRIGKHGQGGQRKPEDTIAVSVPAIVSRDTWQAVQDRLAEMERTASGRRANPRQFLLRGMIKCGKCESAMLAMKNGKHYAYRCSQRHHRVASVDAKCPQRRVITHALENAVWEWVLSIVTNPVEFEQRARAAIEAERDSQGPKLARLKQLAKLIARCDLEIADLANDILAQKGRMKEHFQAKADLLNSQYDTLTKERDKIQSELAAGQASEQDIAELVAFMRDASDELKEADFELKRETLEMLQTHVWVTDDQATVEITISDKHKERSIVATSTSKCKSGKLVAERWVRLSQTIDLIEAGAHRSPKAKQRNGEVKSS